MLRAVNDMVFKFIFGAEERKELLREFVNLALERAGLPLVSTLAIKNPFNLRQFAEDKESVIDIEAEDGSGRIFGLEVQLRRQESYAARAVYYWSRLYGSQLLGGHDYDALHPVIGIHLLDFRMRPGKTRFLKVGRLVDTGDPDRADPFVFTDHQTLITLELPFMDRGADCGRLEKLLLLLESEGGDKEMTATLAEQDRIFAEIDEAYRKFNADPELRSIYEGRKKWQHDQATYLAEARREGLKEGLEEGLKEGLAEGGHSQALRDAMRLKERGVDVDLIAECTGLSRDEVLGA